MKKSKSLVCLMIWFGWAAGKDLDGIVRFNTLSDYVIFSSNGLVPLFFILAFTVFLLNIGALYSLFKLHTKALFTCLSALVAAAIQNVVTMALALHDLEGAKQAYIISRESRGLPVREDALEVIFSIQGMFLTLAIMCVFYAIVAFLLIKSKKYFNEGSRVDV